ncbi:2Fe-2S iron-sulfur cluster binding protein [Aspergillus sp. HF37]|nr:2Fe-2S iron-sulfur cluster binding protein [Aspergillus sp. HF37]
MSFWSEACLHLRRAVPRPAAASRIRLPQSRRCLHLAHTAGIAGSRRTSPLTRDTAAWRTRQSWQGLKAARPFSVTARAGHGNLTPPKPGEEINVSFVDKDGQKFDFQVSEGDNLLDIAQANDLEMEGACGGSCACSTCHVIIEDPEMFDKTEEPSDDENDMLDLAFGLTETSRLGCQVPMNKSLDGMVVRLPSMTRNMQASDFQEKK